MGGSNLNAAFPGSNLLGGDISPGAGGGTSYTFGTGLTNNAGTITNNLATGKAGGLSAIGGTAAGEDLTLSSTTNATKGKVRFGSNCSYYDEAAQALFLRSTPGTASPGVITASDNQGTATWTIGNNSGVRGPKFAVTGLDLIDMQLVPGATVAAARAIRLENRGVGVVNVYSAPELHVGGTNLDDPPLIIGDSVVGIGSAQSNDVNLVVGAGTNDAATRLKVKANKTVAQAVGAVWDGFKFDQSTLTVTGGGLITELAAVRIKQPTATSASVVSVKDAATLIVDGYMNGGGSLAIDGWGADAVYGSTYCAWFKQYIRVDGGVICKGVNTEFTVNNGNMLVGPYNGTGNLTLQAAVIGVSAPVKFNTNVVVNGSVATSLTSLGPTGSRTTVQKWLKVQDGAGADFFIPLF
jgi:hypothetical protein